MSLRFVTTCLLLIIFFISGCTNATGQNVEEAHNPIITHDDGKRVPNEYLVKLTEDSSEDDLYAAFAELGIQSVRNLSKQRFLIRLENDPGPEDVKSLGTASPIVETVQPNYIYQIQ